MTRFQRAKEIIYALLIMIAAVAMIADPGEGYRIIIGIIGLYFTVLGIIRLYYYFTMARFMVGGRRSLYTGIIMFDFGLLAGTLTNVPHYYILLYLIGLHAFGGAVDILRSIESYRYKASWKLKMTHGLIDIMVAIVCVIFLKNINVAVFVYAMGLLYSAVLRIIGACRKTKFIYIQ